MRILFVGAVEFSRRCLEAVLASGGDVVGVVTLEPSASQRHADYAELEPAARAAGIPVARVRDINAPEAIAQMRAWRPDVLFVFGWSQLLGEAVRRIAPMGAIGSHPSLLPRGRGRHPVIWPLVEGWRETGLSFLYIEEGTDTGDILWQRALPIANEDDAGTLYRKIQCLAAEAIREFMPQLAAGTAPRRAQDHRQATVWRRRTEADGRIHWDQPARRIHNLVRALTRPYGGAHTHADTRRVVVWRSAVAPVESVPGAPEAEPGTVVAVDDGAPLVRAADGVVRLVEWDGGECAWRSGQRLGCVDERPGHLCTS